MKILLAPSETKIQGGTSLFEVNNLLFHALYPHRQKLLQAYNTVVQSDDLQSISKMFGLKKECDIARYTTPITNNPTLKAIERYTGVAFDHLDYPNLEDSAQAYIDEHVLLFSNLFGVVKSNDPLPDYRLKQGEAINETKVDRYYKEILRAPLDTYLQDEDILDLRAGFYDKFYKPNKPYTTLKFIKEGKVVSHWAKAYRGIVLRNIALAHIDNLEAFATLPIEGLEINEMQTKGNKTEIVYNIVL